VRFRRKQDPDHGTDDTSAETVAEEQEATGPQDADDLPAEHGRVDLGSLLVGPVEGRELRMQVDEASGQVQSVVVAGEDGALEMRAFAAPRQGDLWSEVRPQIAADMQRRGGRVEEREGRWGTELVCQLTVDRPDGAGQAVQPSRIVGVNGPRWLLRATFLGRPAMELEGTDWDDVLTRVAVRRGAHALPVGEALPLVLPDSARRMAPGQG